MDADPARAQAIAPPGVTAYEDLEQLLGDPAVDVVHVATPPYLHGRIARRAAERRPRTACAACEWPFEPPSMASLTRTC